MSHTLTKIDNKKMTCGFPEPPAGKVRVEGGKLITLEELMRSADKGCRHFWSKRAR